MTIRQPLIQAMTNQHHIIPQCLDGFEILELLASMEKLELCYERQRLEKELALKSATKVLLATAADGKNYLTK